MNKAVILHGTSNSSKGNWIPWLKKQLEVHGWQVWTPDLPGADQPHLTTYLKYIFANVPFPIDADTTIIGHSSGAVAVLGLLQQLPNETKIKQAVLVSAFHTDLGWDKLRGMFEEPYDYQKISRHAQKISLIHSDTDPYVQLSEAEYLAEQLHGELRIIKGQGHFNLEASPTYTEFPKLLAIVLKEPFPGKIILASSFSHVADGMIKHLPANRSKQHVVFIGTAANLYDPTDREWYDNDRQKLDELGFTVTELDIAGKTTDEVRIALEPADIIFVEGGNTLYLLEQAQRCHFGELVAEKIKGGTHYIGISAGSIIAGPDTHLEKYMELQDLKPTLSSYAGFNLVPFVVCPHWGSTYFKNDYLQAMPELYQECSYPLVAISDTQFAVVEDGHVLFDQADTN